MDKELQIAIDGPVAAGKGDIAARLAQQLHLVYIYTGAMYRALALACIRQKIPFKNKEKVLPLLESLSIVLTTPNPDSDKTFRVFLNAEDVTTEIFNQDVAMGTSDVSTIPEVRQVMVVKQQQLAKGKRVVMEGRDIGLRVLPKAQLKIFLTASLEERAQRRFKQWQELGINKTYAETLEDTENRDKQDTTRATDPLTKLPDAWELDTTGLTQEEVTDRIIQELSKRKLL
jgi:CMP/dCMP kinase